MNRKSRHGWFAIPGHQTGERDLAERLPPLEPLRAVARGATVLDLGCAEGLIGKWLVDQGGAVWLDGLDLHEPYLETAREIMRGYRAARFQRCDFDSIDGAELARLNLLGRYDIVMALNIVQKLKDPTAFLRITAALCNRFYALSLPMIVIDDVRSGNVKVDPVRVLESEGFSLTGMIHGRNDKTKGHLGIRMFFKRWR